MGSKGSLASFGRKLYSKSDETAELEKDLSGEFEPISKRAALGGLLGVVAGFIGLASLVLSYITGGAAFPAGGLIELPYEAAYFVYQSPLSIYYSAVFLGLLGIGLLIQARASKKLGLLLESQYPSILYVGGIIVVVAALVVYSGVTVDIERSVQVSAYVTNVAVIGALVVIFWQLLSVLYIDASKTYAGLIAGLGSALFWPLVGVAHAISSLYMPLMAAAYVLLIIGQFCVAIFWTLPASHIREFARSTRVAKMGYGITGFIASVVGGLAVIDGAVQHVGNTEIWYSWSHFYQDPFVDPVIKEIDASFVTFYTPPWLVQGFLLLLIVWAMLAPRLGAMEGHSSHLQEEVIRGSAKWFMVFLAMVGVFGTSLAGTLMGSVAPLLAFFIAVSPGAMMFLAGALYAGKNDIIVGLPLVVASVFILVTPYSLAQFVIIPWLLVVITQAALMIESILRGNCVFSQTFLTVIATAAGSLAFIAFMLGLFGVGPPAIWPANIWFNVSVIPGVSMAVQAPTVMAVVILSLLIRNVSVVGYSRGSPTVSAQMLGTASLFFALMVVMFEGAKSITKQAMTAAAIIFMLYTISFVLVLSLNLDLGSRILKQGHTLEGNLIRVVAAAGLVLGAITALYTFYVFAGFPSPLQIAGVITVLVALVVGLEILNLISWLSAGIRLGFLTGGFRFSDMERE